MDALLQQLIDLVKQTAPQLWAMALKQVSALNAADTTICWVFGAILVIGIIIGIVISATDNGYGEYPTVYWIVFGSIGLGLATTIICNIYMISMRTANPEYYAIQVLMQLVK